MSRDTFILTKTLSEILRAKGRASSHHYCQLQSWKGAIESERNNPDFSCGMGYREMLYLKGLILLFETHPSRGQMGSASSAEVMASCIRLVDIAHQWAIDERPLGWTVGSFVFEAAIIHLDIAIRDHYARSQQSLTDAMTIFSKCATTLGSCAQRFAAFKRHHELYAALAGMVSRFFERDLVASLAGNSWQSLLVN